MSAPEQTGLAGEQQLSAMIIMAKAVTGAGEEDISLLESLCRAELTIWSRRLRPDVTVEDCSDTFCCAAAVSAAADFLTLQSSAAGAASFTAGEVSVRERDAGEVAKVAQSLRETTEHLMSPYIDPQQFQFRSVQG